MTEAKESFGELPEIQKEAAEKFGTTNNPYDAGYILSNGKLLNVSGEIRDLSQSGAIRFFRLKLRSVDTALAEFVVVPSDQQLEVLKQISVGVYSISLTFRDAATRSPVHFKGESLDVYITSPTSEEIDFYFEKVKKAGVFKAMNEARK